MQVFTISLYISAKSYAMCGESHHILVLLRVNAANKISVYIFRALNKCGTVAQILQHILKIEYCCIGTDAVVLWKYCLCAR